MSNKVYLKRACHIRDDEFVTVGVFSSLENAMERCDPDFEYNIIEYTLDTLDSERVVRTISKGRVCFAREGT